MSATAPAGRTPRPLTGRRVLFYLVTFFGIIFAMNFYMVRVAISTFSGVETESSYKAGLSFMKDVAASQAQSARHWNVEAKLQHDGAATGIVISARDAEARALTGLTPDMRLAHPTDRRRDVALQVVETSPGQFRNLTPLPEGQWDLEIGFKHGDETVFFSKSRIVL